MQQEKINFKQYKQMIEDELYQALEALEENDLPTVRSSSGRAKNYTQEAWLVRHDNSE